MRQCAARPCDVDPRFLLLSVAITHGAHITGSSGSYYAMCFIERAPMDSTNFELPALEEPCDACAGTGDSPKAPEYEIRASLNCSKCKGHRLAPTAAGRALLDFLKRRLELREPEVHRSMF